MTALASRSIAELHEKYRQGHSPVTEIEGRVRRIRSEDGAYRSLVFVGSDDALECARQAERRIQDGDPLGPLHGVPIAVKDVIDVRGWPTTAGSRLFDGTLAKEDAGCVSRLRDAGAIIIGKTNLHELTVGGHDNPWFGKVVNPLDLDRGTGGTSSGSAAAVRAAFCLAAIGTDSGGSNRSPAAATGLVGFRPESEAIDRSGVRPTASTFDAIGPIALNLADTWLVYAALRGCNEAEMAPTDPRGLRIGLCPDLYGGTLDPVVEQAIEGWLSQARAAGVVVETVRFAWADRVKAAGKAILFHEFASRYATLVRERPDRVGKAVMQFVSDASAYDRTAYEEALQFRSEARNAFLPLLAKIDLLVTPVAPGLAPRLTDEMTQVGSEFMSYGLAGGSFRRWANFFDLPTLAMPVPTAGNLPASVQVSALPGMERKLFSSCQALSFVA